jgi:AraC-like DNA-binding protein
LLKTSDKSVSDIATGCGYSTVSWFIIQFKKY